MNLLKTTGTANDDSQEPPPNHNDAPESQTQSLHQTTTTPQNHKLKASPRLKNASPTSKPRPNGPPSRCPQSPQGLQARCSGFQVGSPIHRMCTFVRRGTMGLGTQALSLAVQEESKGTPSQIPPLVHGLSGYGLCFTIVHPGSPPPISSGCRLPHMADVVLGCTAHAFYKP